MFNALNIFDALNIHEATGSFIYNRKDLNAVLLQYFNQITVITFFGIAGALKK